MDLQPGSDKAKGIGKALCSRGGQHAAGKQHVGRGQPSVVIKELVLHQLKSSDVQASIRQYTYQAWRHPSASDTASVHLQETMEDLYAVHTAVPSEEQFTQLQSLSPPSHDKIPLAAVLCLGVQ